MVKSWARFAMGVVTISTIAACQTQQAQVATSATDETIGPRYPYSHPTEKPTEAALAPVPAFTPPAMGFSYTEEHISTEGNVQEMLTWTVVSEGGQWTAREDGGDEYGALGAFNYGTHFNMDGRSGSQQFATTQDFLFPLQAGSTARTTYTGSDSNGSSWDGTKVCSVVDTVNITIAAGAFDTYKIVCQQGGNGWADGDGDPWNTETFYFAPSVGLVVFARERNADNREQTYEWVSYSTMTAS